MPMKGLRRNDDAMKSQCWYQKNKTQSPNQSSPFPSPLGRIGGAWATTPSIYHKSPVSYL
jgi:hypothetical protein